MLPPEEGCDTQLHEAVRFGDVDEVIEAVKKGHDPNQIGQYLWSPLHEASSNGEEAIVRILCKHRGDPNKPDQLRGSTSVHYAASQGHPHCLRLLIQAGGRWDAQNNEGRACLDVAIGSCLPILQAEYEKHKAETMSLQAPSPLPSITISEETIDEDKDICDIDAISISTSESSSSSHLRTWSPSSVVGFTRTLALGTAELSFEYNSKKGVFKVRVWQVEDLLLPPPESSKISGIYLKSYLHPDKRKNSKRKTEELPVYSPHEINASNTLHTDSGTSVVLKPSSFKFMKALEYTKVTKETVETKILEIVLCVAQKYTRKTYSVSTWTMPLKQAVRKVMKEKYTLKPCLSLNIPQNMKIYHNGQLKVPRSPHTLSNSNPNLRRPASTGSWAVPYSERSASDSDLHGVKIERTPSSKASSIELTVAEEEEELELQNALQQIAIMEENEHKASHNIAMPSNTVDDDNDIDVVTHTTTLAEVEVHVPAEKAVKTKSKFHIKRKSKKKSNTDVNESHGIEIQEIKPQVPMTDENDVISRPETPEWDEYNEPLSLVPVEFEDDIPDHLMSLPMAVSLDMPDIHCSFKAQETSLTVNDATTVPCDHEQADCQLYADTFHYQHSNEDEFEFAV